MYKADRVEKRNLLLLAERLHNLIDLLQGLKPRQNLLMKLLMLL